MSRTLLEMPNLSSNPSVLNVNLHVNKISMLFECTLTFEHCIREKYSEKVKNELLSGNMVRLWRIKVECIENREINDCPLTQIYSFGCWFAREGIGEKVNDFNLGMWYLIAFETCFKVENGHMSLEIRS